MQIDLDRHAIIEASAGTGKTYALEQLVLRLLMEKQIELEQVLLVTFTEKATGELKSRLRETLERESQNNPAHRRVLQAALDAFDQAHIYTIHAFCQRVLQEYAFEHRADFRPQLVNDREILPSCLREVQRKIWRQEYQEGLPVVLELAGYNASGDGGKAWEQLVLEIAERFRPACGHRLKPDQITGWLEKLHELETRLQGTVPTLRQLAEPLDPNRLEQHPWYVGFDQLRHYAQQREARRKGILMPLLRWLAASRAAGQLAPGFRRFLQQCTAADTFSRHGFLVLTDRLCARARAELPDRCPGLQELVNHLEALRQSADWRALDHCLTVQTVHQLQEHLAIYKRERGLQSFEDMLTRVDDALNPARNPHCQALVAALRGRYRYAIADEFQDTDPIQWRIFQRIFVESSQDHRLFVVGDPKQAIFGFRGADLHTYLIARAALKREHQAQEHPLHVNWRSCPELLEDLNGLFQRGGWFDKSDINFIPVQAPPLQERTYRIVSDETGRKGLTLVDLSDTRTLLEARWQNAKFIAAEVRRLLPAAGCPPLLQFELKGSPTRALRPSDICVLVYSRREGNPVLQALRHQGVPCSFYKQTGLWQSPEAVQVSYLLRAIARPEERQAFHKALLTRFYRIPPADLACCQELPPHHAARELYQRWVELAQERNWAQLFQSLLEDTGLLFHGLDAADADRVLANYRHILQTLELAAYGQDLDMLGVLEFLEQKRRCGGEEADWQPIETERPKVLVMTIHASKGLEFPVVFLAGGFTQRRCPGYLTYPDEPPGHWVLDLRRQELSARAADDRERAEEDRRLLYVALTRARFKLYAPKVPTGTHSHPGPIATILAPAAEKAGLEVLGRLDYETAREFTTEPAENTEQRQRRTAGTNPAEHLAKPTRLSPASATSVYSVPNESTSPPVIDNLAELFPRLDPNLARRRIRIRSFSSLRRDRPTAVEAPTYAERAPRGDDDLEDALDGHDPLRGRVFGDMVHEVLEKIDFAVAGKAGDSLALLQEGSPSRSLIDDQLQRHLPKLLSRLSGEQLEQACREQIAGLVWNGLHTPLSAAGGPLWQVPLHDRLQELEFHFPEADAFMGTSSPEPGDEGTLPFPPLGKARARTAEDFLTGFMDLVFRKNGQYFLVDWKTNWLPQGYALPDLMRSMDECDYRRQYRLYLHALARWLRRVQGEAFHLHRDLGGVYYLYLRGMNGRDESSGVFFCRPGEHELRLEEVLTAD